MKSLIVISGPTACGKTALSVAVAKHFNTSIISADSRQFYKELSIGTAKPTLEEQDGVDHFFIDSHSVEDEISSAQFEQEAITTLMNEFESKETVILTGGSGMFIDALCFGLDQIPTSLEVKNELENQLKTQGIISLLSELEQKDPEFFKTVDQSNSRRIIRALEAIRITGDTYSNLRKNRKKNRGFTPHFFIINHDREILYNRINDRVDLMMDAGLLDEVKSVQKYRGLSSLNTVGYKELFSFIDGELSLEEAIEELKKNTRRYAKRQLTWFRRYENAIWIDYSTNLKMKDQIVDHMNRIRN